MPSDWFIHEFIFQSQSENVIPEKEKENNRPEQESVRLMNLNGYSVAAKGEYFILFNITNWQQRQAKLKQYA